MPRPWQAPCRRITRFPVLYLPKGIEAGSKPRPAVIVVHMLGGGFEFDPIAMHGLGRTGNPGDLVQTALLRGTGYA